MSKENSQVLQYRVDSKIVNIFILFGIIGLGFLSYRFYTYTPQPDVNFAVLGSSHKVKEMIKFENYTAGKHEFLWEFGDSTKSSVRRDPVHVYKNPGEYEVSLLVDNKYKKTCKVAIGKEYRMAPDVVMPKVIGPSSVVAGKTFALTCPTENVRSYVWYVNGSPVGYKKQFDYQFDKPGYKQVTLIVNGERRYSVTKDIYVKQQKDIAAKEVVEKLEDNDDNNLIIPDDPNVYKKIAKLNKKDEDVWFLPQDEELKIEFLNVMDEKGPVDKFTRYLKGGADYQQIFANSKYVTLNELMEDLKGKDFVIKDFHTLRNENIITKLTIKYRIKRKIF